MSEHRRNIPHHERRHPPSGITNRWSAWRDHSKGFKRVCDEEIDQRKANLPLPEQPPAASDLRSANMQTTGRGSGTVSGDHPSET
ncbi:hypothetical protein ACO22_04294 [Paracoccidioides brasiliensis]|uniref:Uncharacterized protein n=1 Tax=Paracoccidioides brasiliensis TaxID=121759 RepID=A0A1D2JDL8_PARBR|nr:hypothetical protein ACO22_04294 [Paracoccidioides brasiliensis]